MRIALTMLLLLSGHAALAAPLPARAYGEAWTGFTQTAAEQQIVKRIQALLGKARPAIQLDPALSRAAREYGAHAAMAAAEGKQLGGATLSEDLWRSGRVDVDVLPLVIKGGDRPERMDIATRFVQDTIAGRGYTHFGAGISGEVATLLFSRRGVTLRPFPRSLPGGKPVELPFALGHRLRAPEVLMTTAAGKVRRTPMRPGDRPGEVVALLSPVDGDGEYTIEILARGPRGPVVGALFPLYFGKPAPALPRIQLLPVTPPPTPREALQRAAVVLDRARSQRGLPLLKRDGTLAQIAATRVQELANEQDLAHASPDGEVLLDRLNRAGLPVGRAAENLAVGPTPEAAARACLRSPSHLANLIDERSTHGGLAVTASRSPGGSGQFTLVQLFVELLPEAAGHLLADKLFHGINEKRRSAGLKVLQRNEDLDRVALRHCRTMIHEDHFGDELPDGHSLVDEVGRRTDVRHVAADLFVTPRIDKALGSDKLLGARHEVVGLAVIQASSPRYGANLLWMVIVYGRD